MKPQAPSVPIVYNIFDAEMKNNSYISSSRIPNSYRKPMCSLGKNKC